MNACVAHEQGIMYPNTVKQPSQFFLMEDSRDGANKNIGYTQGYSPLDPDRYLFWLKKLLREVNDISENQNCHAEP